MNQVSAKFFSYLDDNDHLRLAMRQGTTGVKLRQLMDKYPELTNELMEISESVNQDIDNAVEDNVETFVKIMLDNDQLCDTMNT